MTWYPLCCGWLQRAVQVSADGVTKTVEAGRGATTAAAAAGCSDSRGRDAPAAAAGTALKGGSSLL
jgi:hypothetical protein